MPLKRVKDPDDARRCIGRGAQGEQCWNIAEEDDERCCACGGKRPDSREEHQDYLSEQYKRRIRIESNDDPVKVLKDNLMDLNAMIACHRNKIKNDGSLDSNSSALIDLVMKTEKLTNTLHRLSITSGLLLARPALVRWAQSILHAVSDVIQDKYDGWEDDLVELSNIIAGITVQAKNEEGETP